MRTSLAAAAALTLASSACFAGMGLRGSGKMKTERREVPPFAALVVESGIQVTVSIGPQKPLELSGEDNILQILVTKVEDGRLRIGFPHHTNIWSHQDVQVNLTAPKLREVDASGGAEVRGQLASVDALRLDSSGGGQLHLTGIDTPELTLDGSGGAEIELAGKADRFSLEMSGGSQVHASKLSVQSMRVSGSGGSEGEVRVSEKIKGELSGGSSLKVIGKASTRVATSGGSSVDYQE